MPGPAPRAAEAGNAVADVVVTDAVDVAAAADEAVLVTLAALARSAGGPVPTGVVDEARELATHGDVFDAWDEPDGSDPALRAAGEVVTYADLVAAPGRPAGRSGCTPTPPTPRRSCGSPCRSGRPTDRWS